MSVDESEGESEAGERKKSKQKIRKSRAESIFAQVILSDKTGVSTISRAVTWLASVSAT